MRPLIAHLKKNAARLIAGRRSHFRSESPLTFTQSCTSCLAAHPSNGLRLVK